MAIIWPYMLLHLIILMIFTISCLYDRINISSNSVPNVIQLQRKIACLDFYIYTFVAVYWLLWSPLWRQEKKIGKKGPLIKIVPFYHKLIMHSSSFFFFYNKWLVSNKHELLDQFFFRPFWFQFFPMGHVGYWKTIN